MFTRQLLGILLFALSFSLSVAKPDVLQNNSYDAGYYGLPRNIAGYEVLAVLTPENTACMLPNSKELVVFTSAPNLDTFLNTVEKDNIERELVNLEINQKLTGIRYVGLGISKNDFIDENNKSSIALKANGCIKGDLISNRVMALQSQYNPGFAVFQNKNAGDFTNDNAQSVNLVAPYWDGYSTGQISWWNNVWTNTNYFLQAGFAYPHQPDPLMVGESGHVVWADTSTNFIPRSFNLLYFPGHTYFFTITFTNSYWWMCVNNNNIPGGTSYICQKELNATGNNLQDSPNTSIFLENGSPNANWHQNFHTSTIFAKQAKIYLDGIGRNWTKEQKLTFHQCTSPYPSSGALSGSLLNAGTGSFILSGVPLRCP